MSQRQIHLHLPHLLNKSFVNTDGFKEEEEKGYESKEHQNETMGNQHEL